VKAGGSIPLTPTISSNPVAPTKLGELMNINMILDEYGELEGFYFNGKAINWRHGDDIAMLFKEMGMNVTIVYCNEPTNGSGLPSSASSLSVISSQTV
jgi:hypothetical protein